MGVGFQVHWSFCGVAVADDSDGHDQMYACLDEQRLHDGATDDTGHGGDSRSNDVGHYDEVARGDNFIGKSVINSRGNIAFRDKL
mmetsp:Transcript_82304/g.233113  ORF Transcript_82304/g.233113 Transcript_82304/m.233113 type:complete len:85 (+) Transcript_82304:180-434(+)